MRRFGVENGQIQYLTFHRAKDLDNTNFALVQNISLQVLDMLNQEQVLSDIKEVHHLGASSHKVQAVIMSQMKTLGFASEKRGLFSNYKVAGIRPDYYKPIPGGGILFEVERGKTLANNMDLLDVWKTHICKEAQHLFLLVPKIRVSAKGAEQKIFNTVANRVETFFADVITPIDVTSVHLFGY
jgi:hypothetical protein